jgi:hypothetical protein
LLIDDGITPISAQSDNKRLQRYNFVTLTFSNNVLKFEIKSGDPDYNPDGTMQMQFIDKIRIL